jgi:hypothetical protein
VLLEELVLGLVDEVVLGLVAVDVLELGLVAVAERVELAVLSCASVLEVVVEGVVLVVEVPRADALGVPYGSREGDVLAVVVLDDGEVLEDGEVLDVVPYALEDCVVFEVVADEEDGEVDEVAVVP